MEMEEGKGLPRAIFHYNTFVEMGKERRCFEPHFATIKLWNGRRERAA